MTAVVVAAVAVAVGQLVQGILGFGSALVAVPVLMWVFGPAEAIVLQAMLDLAGTGALILGPRGRIRVGVVAAVAAPLLLGQVVGTELLVALPERAVRGIAGAVVAALGAWILVRQPQNTDGAFDEPGPAALYGGGALAGFTGGLMAGVVGPSGPPIVLWARRCFPPVAFRAQLVGVFFVGSLSLVGVCVARGLVDRDRIGTAALLLVPGLLGAALGARIAPRLPAATFARVVGAVLLASGVALALG